MSSESRGKESDTAGRVAENLVTVFLGLPSPVLSDVWGAEQSPLRAAEGSLAALA